MWKTKQKMNQRTLAWFFSSWNGRVIFFLEMNKQKKNYSQKLFGNLFVFIVYFFSIQTNIYNIRTNQPNK